MFSCCSEKQQDAFPVIQAEHPTRQRTDSDKFPQLRRGCKWILSRWPFLLTLKLRSNMQSSLEETTETWAVSVTTIPPACARISTRTYIVLSPLSLPCVYAAENPSFLQQFPQFPAQNVQLSSTKINGQVHSIVCGGMGPPRKRNGVSKTPTCSRGEN